MSTSTSITTLDPFVLPTPILTTTFTPPPQCSTQFAERGRIILNPMLPPIDSAQATCYEEQFVDWYTAFAYTQLVCPSGYHTQSAFESPAGYIACCPSGFDGLSLYDDAPTNRPAYLASCLSTLPASGLVVTYSDNAARALSTSTYTPTSSGEVAYAFPYDGTAVPTGGISSAKATATTSRPPVTQVTTAGAGRSKVAAEVVGYALAVFGYLLA